MRCASRFGTALRAKKREPLRILYRFYAFTGTVPCVPAPPAAPGVFLPELDPGHTGTVPASCHMCVARLPSAQG